MSSYLKSILNAFHDLIFVFTNEGIIEDYLTTNHQDELILPKEVFLGKHYSKVLPPHVSSQIEQAFSKIDEGEEYYSFDYSMELKGKSQWFTAVISQIEHKNKPGYLGVVRNITVRKNQELLLKGVLNTSPGGIMVFDSVRDSDDNIVDFEITHVNKSVEELTGATEQELIGEKLTVVVAESIKESMLDRFKTVVETGNPVEFQYEHINEQNESIWYHSKVAKYQNGVVTNFMDITEHKNTEEELAKTNKELKELNRQKDKLFSVISHDLRNLIAGSIGVYDMILEDYEELSKEELFEYVSLLYKRAGNATNLLEDLLSWSKNQFQEVTSNPEKLHLTEVTNSVFNSVSPNADNKGIHLKNKVPDDIFVYADANMIKTTLRNLIANGIKFSHPGGKIVVRAERRDDEAQVSVTDEGVGIEKDALKKIFDKKNNYTTHGTDGEKGSGLGLDLCRDFVEMQGGKIWAESKPNKGSTFIFTLPNVT